MKAFGSHTFLLKVAVLMVRSEVQITIINFDFYFKKIIGSCLKICCDILVWQLEYFQSIL